VYNGNRLWDALDGVSDDSLGDALSLGHGPRGGARELVATQHGDDSDVFRVLGHDCALNKAALCGTTTAL